jgi:prepilin-type N-terminal cleavage/methylation domain-containing protein
VEKKGFTLVEMLVTVAIVAILAAIAIPLYNGYILRARKQEASDALLTAKTCMLRYKLDNSTFAGASFKPSDNSLCKYGDGCCGNSAGEFTFSDSTVVTINGTPDAGFDLRGEMSYDGATHYFCINNSRDLAKYCGTSACSNCN